MIHGIDSIHFAHLHELPCGQKDLRRTGAAIQASMQGSRHKHLRRATGRSHASDYEDTQHRVRQRRHSMGEPSFSGRAGNQNKETAESMKLPEIKGFVDLSLVDWDGKVSAVLFLPHCNFRCPFCYNTTLVLEPDRMATIPYEEVEQYLTRNKKWLDGVAITGGEPTLQPALPTLCQWIKRLDLQVKLDTNGTNSPMVQKLIADALVDYIALDVKAPLNNEKYSQSVGINAEKLLSKVGTTIDILLANPVDYEFRTTLVPTIHKQDDIRQICRRIEGCRKYILQNFKGGVETLDPKCRNITPFSPHELAEFLRLARETVPNTALR
jgi:pyruvate formate lyase activating enzyme